MDVVLMLGLPVAILVGYAWLSRRAVRRGVGHSFMTPFEDMWDPARGRTEVVVEQEAHQPGSIPGDPPKPGEPARTPAPARAGRERD